MLRFPSLEALWVDFFLFFLSTSFACVLFLYMCAYMSVMCVQVTQNQKGELDRWDLELQVVVRDLTWMLGTKPSHSARAARALNGGCRAISPGP